MDARACVGLLLLILLVKGAESRQDLPLDCSKPRVYDYTTSSCFDYVNMKKKPTSYEEATQLCPPGFGLVSVESQYKMTLLYNQFKNRDTGPPAPGIFWTSGYRANKNEAYYWHWSNNQTLPFKENFELVKFQKTPNPEENYVSIWFVDKPQTFMPIQESDNSFDMGVICEAIICPPPLCDNHMCQNETFTDAGCPVCSKCPDPKCKMVLQEDKFGSICSRCDCQPEPTCPAIPSCGYNCRLELGPDSNCPKCYCYPFEFPIIFEIEISEGKNVNNKSLSDFCIMVESNTQSSDCKALPNSCNIFDGQFTGPNDETYEARIEFNVMTPYDMIRDQVKKCIYTVPNIISTRLPEEVPSLGTCKSTIKFDNNFEPTMSMLNKSPCLQSRRDKPCPLGKSYSIRYEYSKSDGSCTPFEFDGCQSEDNNAFRTKSDCEKKCDLDRCYLPVQPGPCRAKMDRYAYNIDTGKCFKFNYGGCGGNANNFMTESECINKCDIVKCSMPIDQGSTACYGHSDMYQWYHIKNDYVRDCMMGPYSGCLGNTNRFGSKEECQLACMKDTFTKTTTSSTTTTTTTTTTTKIPDTDTTLSTTTPTTTTTLTPEDTTIKPGTTLSEVSFTTAGGVSEPSTEDNSAPELPDPQHLLAGDEETGNPTEITESTDDVVNSFTTSEMISEKTTKKTDAETTDEEMTDMPKTTSKVPEIKTTKSQEMNTDEMNTDEMNTDEMNTDEMNTDEMNTDEMNTDEMNTDEIKTDTSTQATTISPVKVTTKPLEDITNEFTNEEHTPEINTEEVKTVDINTEEPTTLTTVGPVKITTKSPIVVTDEFTDKIITGESSNEPTEATTISAVKVTTKSSSDVTDKFTNVETPEINTNEPTKKTTKVSTKSPTDVTNEVTNETTEKMTSKATTKQPARQTTAEKTLRDWIRDQCNHYKNNPDYCTCELYGDPMLYTYDRFITAVEGLGTYLLSSNPTFRFELTAQLVQSDPNNFPAILTTHQVVLSLEDVKLFIEPEQIYYFIAEDREPHFIDPPHSDPNFSLRGEIGGVLWALTSTNISLMVDYTDDNNVAVVFSLPRQYLTHNTGGFCRECDGVKDNDCVLHSPDGGTGEESVSADPQDTTSVVETKKDVCKEADKYILMSNHYRINVPR